MNYWQNAYDRHYDDRQIAAIREEVESRIKLMQLPGFVTSTKDWAEVLKFQMGAGPFERHLSRVEGGIAVSTAWEQITLARFNAESKPHNEMDALLPAFDSVAGGEDFVRVNPRGQIKGTELFSVYLLARRDWGQWMTLTNRFVRRLLELDKLGNHVPDPPDPPDPDPPEPEPEAPAERTPEEVAHDLLVSWEKLNAWMPKYLLSGVEWAIESFAIPLIKLYRKAMSL